VSNRTGGSVAAFQIFQRSLRPENMITLHALCTVLLAAVCGRGQMWNLVRALGPLSHSRPSRLGAARRRLTPGHYPAPLLLNGHHPNHTTSPALPRHETLSSPFTTLIAYTRLTSPTSSVLIVGPCARPNPDRAPRRCPRSPLPQIRRSFQDSTGASPPATSLSPLHHVSFTGGLFGIPTKIG
jgi:hypothetical protein